MGELVPTPDYVELLRSVPLFENAPTETLEQVAKMTSDVTHDKGHVVVREGAGAHFLHVILSGGATVTAEGRHIATLGPGDHFGEIALVDERRRTATVTAETDLHVLAIDATSLRRLYRSDATLRESLPRVVTDRLRDLEAKLAD